MAFFLSDTAPEGGWYMLYTIGVALLGLFLFCLARVAGLKDPEDVPARIDSSSRSPKTIQDSAPAPYLGRRYSLMLLFWPGLERRKGKRGES